MTTYVIPPDYVGLRDVQRRAQALWGGNEAPGRLKYLLTSNGLPVWCADDKGQLIQKPASLWTSREGEHVLQRDEFHNAVTGSGTGRPVFLRAEVDKVFQVKVILEITNARPETAPPADSSAIQNKGGAPSKFPDELWVEMVRYLFLKGIPENYAVLTKHVQERCVALSLKEPSKNGIHDRVKLLIDALRQDDES